MYIRIKNESISVKISKLDMKINQKLKDIILHKNKFLDLDSKFGNEITKAIDESRRACCRTNFFST